MKMDMKDCLSRIAVAVHDKPEALFGKPFVFSHFAGSLKHMPYQFIVLLACFKYGGYVFLWHNEDMKRGLRVYIIECEDMLIFIYSICRYTAFNNPAEQTIHLNASCNKKVFSIIIHPMEFYNFTLDELKESKKFLENINWDLTPKAFMAPRTGSRENLHNTSEVEALKYMLYVDKLEDRPVVMVMKIRGGMSTTTGCIDGIPEDLLIEVIKSSPDESEAGMFPLSEQLRDWLKREFGLV